MSQDPRLSRGKEGDEHGTKGEGAPLTRTTLSGLFWMFMGTGAQALLQIVVVAVLARLLNPEDFGVVSAALIIVGFSSIFSQLGVGPAVVQRPQLEDRHVKTGFTLSLIFGLLMTGAVWLFAPTAARFFHIEELPHVIRVLSFVFTLQGVSMIAEALVQRELRFRWLAVIEVTAFVAGYGAFGVTLAYLGFGVWALVGAQLAQAALKTVILLIVQPHPKGLMLERRALTDLMYFGGGFTAARIGNYIAGQVDNLVVGRWLGPEALGIYGRAHQLMTAPANFFGQVLDRVLFPAMVKIQDHSQRLTVAYRRGVALIALVMLPASAVLFVLAPELIHVLLGPQWHGVIAPFQVFAVGMILRTSYKMSDSMARATGAVYRRAWRQSIYAVLVAAGAWAGLRWGLSGVALGVLVAIAVNFFLMAQLSVSVAGISWGSILGAHRPAFVLTAILGLLTWGVRAPLRNWNISAPLILLAAGYVALVTTLLLVRFAPRLVLGADGLWMLQTLGSYLPVKLDPFRSAAFDIDWTKPQERGSTP